MFSTLLSPYTELGGVTGVEPKDYFKDQKELRLYFDPIIHPTDKQTDSLFTQPLEIGKTNIVVIIVESYSQEYMNGYTPFLSSLAQKINRFLMVMQMQKGVLMEFLLSYLPYLC